MKKILFLIVIAVLVSGCIIGDSERDSAVSRVTPNTIQSSTTTPTIDETLCVPVVAHTNTSTTVASISSSYHFTGHESQSTNMFHLNPGFATITFEQTINPDISLFQAYLYNSKGELVNIIANGLDDKTITVRQEIIIADDYYITMNTHHDWDITITQ